MTKSSDLMRKVVADLERTKEMFSPEQLDAFHAAASAAQNIAAVLPSPAFLRAIQTATDYARWHNQLVEGMALEREFLPKMASFGWLISPLAPWDEPERLHTLYQNGGIAAVDRDLLGLDADDCRALVDEITTSRPAFAEWTLTFGKALDAMARGDHELAIPIWLAAIDGICKSELRIRVYSTVADESGRTAVQAQLLGEAANFAREPLVIAWLEVLVGFTGHRKGGTGALLNRHAVMHGLRPAIGTRKDALQCLLALHVLAYLLELRDKYSARAAVAART